MSNTVDIYRVENSDGFGMYFANGTTFSSIHFDVYGESVNDYFQPGPEFDGDLGFRTKWVNRDRDYNFGFASIEQFMNWTRNDECRYELKRVGFHVNVYRVKEQDMFASLRQACFIMDEAEFVRSIDIEEFCDE